MTMETPVSPAADASKNAVSDDESVDEEEMIRQVSMKLPEPKEQGKDNRQRRVSMYQASESFIKSSEARLFEESYHPGVLHLYYPPRQRQRWGDKRVLPRINWGDLYFDLFYVAATYNISYILVADPSSTGFLYFMGTFASVMHLWSAKTFYDSTFVVEDDLYHRLLEIVFLTALGSAIVHIRTADMLSNPADYIDMFALSLSLLVGHFMSLLRQVEIGIKGVGDEDILKQVSRRNSLDAFIPLAFQLAATIITGLEYYRNADASHRMLAGGSGSSNHLPIVLTLAGPLTYQIQWMFRGIFLFPSDGSHVKIIVPMNIDFTIHRNAEWTMLMLGESVFSLLVEDVSESNDFYATFYCGLITVIFLQYIHFKSQPMVAERHVLVNSKDRAIISQLVLMIYSASLVGLGAALTLFLKTFKGSYRRWLAEILDGRMLAGGDPLYDKEELKERAAMVYSIALGMTLLSVDLLSLLHVGINQILTNLRESDTKAKFLIIFFGTFRLALLIFVFTLCLWTTTPNVLAGVGLGCVIVQTWMCSAVSTLANKKNETEESEDVHH